MNATATMTPAPGNTPVSPHRAAEAALDAIDSLDGQGRLADLHRRVQDLPAEGLARLTTSGPERRLLELALGTLAELGDHRDRARADDAEDEAARPPAMPLSAEQAAETPAVAKSAEDVARELGYLTGEQANAALARLRRQRQAAARVMRHFETTVVQTPRGWAVNVVGDPFELGGGLDLIDHVVDSEEAGERLADAAVAALELARAHFRALMAPRRRG